MFRFRFDLGRVDNESGKEVGPIAAFQFLMQPHLVVSVPVDADNNRQVLVSKDDKGRVAVVAYGLEEGDIAFNLNYFRDKEKLLHHLGALGLNVQQMQQVQEQQLLPAIPQVKVGPLIDMIPPPSTRLN